MNTLGYKENVINDLVKNFLVLDAAGNAATTAANVATLLVPGMGTYSKAKMSKVVLSRAVPKRAKIATITPATDVVFSSPAEPVNVQVVIEATSARHEGEFIRDKQSYGKTYLFDFNLAAGASNTDFTNALFTAIDFRQKGYNDLPFVVSNAVGVLTVTSKVGYEHIDFAFHTYMKPKAVSFNGSGEVYGAITTLKMTVTQTAIEGSGLGAWVEQNVSMHTPDQWNPYGAKEKVDIYGKYLTLSFSHSFVSDAIAAPSFVGEETQSGSTNQIIYLNEKDLANAGLVAAIEALLGVAGAVAFDKTGTLVAGADAAAKKVVFIA